MKLKCPSCGKGRDYRPATIKRLKSHLCRKCQEQADVEVKCPRCGKIKKMKPWEIKHFTRFGKLLGYCRGCERVYETAIPNTWDAGYVVGAILGDGSLLRVREPTGFKYTVRLSGLNKGFINRFQEVFQRLRGGPVWMNYWSGRKKANPKIRMPETQVLEWIVGATDRLWYEKLKPLKIDRDYSSLLQKGKNFKQGLIQGLLDAEGYVVGREIAIINKDMGLLETIKQCLSDLGYRPSIQGPYPSSRGVARVRFRGNMEKVSGVLF